MDSRSAIPGRRHHGDRHLPLNDLRTEAPDGNADVNPGAIGGDHGLCAMSPRAIRLHPDGLNDAGSAPAASLDSTGTVTYGGGALALAVAVTTGDLLGASGPLLETVGDG